MDKLSIFTDGVVSSTVTTVNGAVNTLDDVVSELSDIVRELQLTRKGHEEWTWGEGVEDSEIDLKEVN